MTAHTAPQDMNLLLTDAFSRGVSPEAARIAAKRASRRTLGARISGFLAYLAELRQRRAVLAELNMLNDHELADIGLSRVDLPRVFDPAFAAARSEMQSEAQAH